MYIGMVATEVPVSRTGPHFRVDAQHTQHLSHCQCCGTYSVAEEEGDSDEHNSAYWSFGFTEQLDHGIGLRQVNTNEPLTATHIECVYSQIPYANCGIIRRGPEAFVCAQ
jgi:hypothetical protein